MRLVGCNRFSRYERKPSLLSNGKNKDDRERKNHWSVNVTDDLSVMLTLAINNKTNGSNVHH